jgi:hypothetical protein
MANIVRVGLDRKIFDLPISDKWPWTIERFSNSLRRALKWSPKAEITMARRKRRKKKYKIDLRAAARAPNWVRVVAAGIRPTPEELRRWRDRLNGRFGPASEVRHIAPEDWVSQKRPSEK